MLTIEQQDDLLIMKSAHPYKVLSSAMINPGIGYYSNFVNRTVPIDYYPHDALLEYTQFLHEEGLSLQNTIAMMTAVSQRFVFMNRYDDLDTSIFVVITAGLGNAVDVTRSHQYTYEQKIGTINIFVFLDAKVSEEALIQAYSCIIEAKTKVLMERNVMDRKSETTATGTSTDSTAVAVSEQGEFHQYGGSITRLGSLIGKGVAQTLNDAIDDYFAYKRGEIV
ncbi:adenosylcobinamide amidohydrolase [Solibacillus sp. CAU 1738]|uniref:adenosylcobinamide amidohydrolase n=1 Tax=Solibacillus sp. CAU 1738 TaxID=3140363 RepID=UPI0032616FD2